jgi:hypothetical protein
MANIPACAGKDDQHVARFPVSAGKKDLDAGKLVACT